MSDDRLMNSVRFTSAPKDADTVASLFRELRDASRREPGVIEFEVGRSRGKPNVFAFWEVYRDQEALNAHVASEHFQRLFRKGRPAVGAGAEHREGGSNIRVATGALPITRATRLVLLRRGGAGVSETTGFMFALLTWAAGFAVRPLGALVFGRLGDSVGRKRTFLMTIVIMDTATAVVGILPTYASVGLVAPIALVALRLLQRLAVGGEYGGAAVYVAEHAPPGKRGLYTSWIQTASTLGLILSLLVIMSCRALKRVCASPRCRTRLPTSSPLTAVLLWRNRTVRSMGNVNSRGRRDVY